jgi:hypothetical protein
MTPIKIKVRPKETVQFPGLCVHCGQPGDQPMLIQKRIGRATRLIDVPLCATCAAHLHRRSADEERLRKIRWLVCGVLLLLALAVTLLLTPAGMAFWLRLGLAAGVAVALTAVSWHIIGRSITNAALPEKKAVRDAARIEHFSWRATTFSFAHPTFIQRFRELNEPYLMEL